MTRFSPSPSKTPHWQQRLSSFWGLNFFGPQNIPGCELANGQERGSAPLHRALARAFGQREMRRHTRAAYVALCLSVFAGGASADTPLPEPLTDADFRPVSLDEAMLGQLLFYDPILSGNREVACATCHHPRFGTSDGVSLGLGDGGTGLGPERQVDPSNLPEARIPRNSPALFNLGARDLRVLFHDGRIEVDETRASGFRTPLGADMETGFASLVSAQTMFPVLSDDEMAGHYGENEISRAVRQGLITGPGGAWDLISRRVAEIPDYAVQFRAIYPHVADPEDIHFTDISNAIAAFMEFEWRSDQSPFDAYLRGERALPDLAAEGMSLFYGEAGCATCHAGPFLTDQAFHAMAAPQVGPGKAAAFETHARDDGRFRVTGRDEDRFAFRTPSLRNVAVTAPYGHAGAHATLEAFLRDHGQPEALEPFNRDQVILPRLDVDDWRILDDPAEVQAIAAAAQTLPRLSDADIAALVAFLDALTDPSAIEGRLGIPASVPSGLAVTR